MNSKYDIFYYLFILNYSVLSFQAHDNILPFNTDQNCWFLCVFSKFARRESRSEETSSTTQTTGKNIADKEKKKKIK